LQEGAEIAEKDEEDEDLLESQVETVAELGFDGQILRMVLDAGKPPGSHNCNVRRPAVP
jgi:hypothetical protein